MERVRLTFSHDHLVVINDLSKFHSTTSVSLGTDVAGIKSLGSRKGPVVSEIDNVYSWS